MRLLGAFGTGPRARIGRQFAQHQITAALAAILHQFDLEPDPDYRLDVCEPHPRIRGSTTAISPANQQQDCETNVAPHVMARC
ncbi:cytochrome P450 [Nocardia sp. bgisy134]|uniref:cytochrome P450 n=1 Tax=Nocardia sp. bgisy134 TaxID=3413789 RepID=UPI003D70CCFB